MNWVEAPAIEIFSDSEHEADFVRPGHESVVVDLLTQPSSAAVVVDLLTQATEAAEEPDSTEPVLAGGAQAQDEAAAQPALAGAADLQGSTRSNTRPTRWGRCWQCTRALRPWSSVQGEVFLLCPRLKVGAHHARVRMTTEQVVAAGLPTRVVRRTRVGF